MKRWKWGLVSIILCFGFLVVGCPPDEEKYPEVVGVMYHHWWVPGRWSDNPSNHPYEPVLGHYDNADPAIIRQHITWAKQYGINTFVMNFWITDRDWSWVERNTTAVADICDQEGMNYFFLIDGFPEFLEESDPAYEIAWRVNDRAAPFFSRPGYLKKDGKPVLFFWLAFWYPCELWNSVRSGIEGTSGPIFMTGDHKGCFDMRMMYNPYTPDCTTYNCQIEHQKDMWEDRSGESEPWAPTALAGYDDHLVRSGNPIIPLDPDFFRESLQTAMNFNQYHPDGKRWLFINSWSEWHEGSQVEPAADFQDPEIFLKVLDQELNALR